MNQEICAICKEAECKFETRCGHFFHYKCLRGVFDKCTEMRCHYCKEPVPADRPYIEKYLPAGWSNIEGCPRLVFHGKCSEKWDKLFSNYKCPQCGQGISANAKIERVIKDPELIKDTDISNRELDSWVSYAVNEADLSFFEMLCIRRAYSDFYFALKFSAECGRLDLVKHFVEHGLDISWGNYAALESSLEHGQLDVYKYLIERIGFTPKLLYEQVTLGIT